MKSKIMVKKLLIIAISAVTFLCTIFVHTKSDEASLIPLDKGIMAGHASWYSHTDRGINRHTANNEIFDDHDLTCAMWNVPFNQKLRVTNIENGKSIVVRVNDRGPHKRFVRKGRVIDLTKTAFRRIAGTHKGLIRVQVEFL
jgi:rare lipoprotein A